METAVADPLTGRVLDRRYRVGAPIARGGMSVVYAGTDLRLDRQVAIKVMAAGLARDPVFVDRFTREARAAARLSHVNAVAVYDQGADGGHVFLVMELVRGRTLRDLLAERRRLEPDEAVSLLEPVLAVLAAAHRAGLVHRDVKPENVLLSDDGVVKVADFGLARAVAAASTSTQAGVVFGTVGYVAPEQVAHGRADPRSDVYSAGILLYELLTGAPPYTGDSAVAVAYRHVHDDVPPPSRAVAGIPPALDELVLRATRREPGARPPDAGAFLAELAHVRADLGLRRVPAPVRTGRPPRQLALPGPAGVAGLSTAATGRPGPAEISTDPRLDPYARAGQSTAALPGPVRPPPPARARLSGPPPRYENEQRAHRRRLAVGLVLVLLLGVAAAGASWWYGSGRFVQVPPLAGLTQRQATDQAAAAHLQVRFGQGEFSGRVPIGRVVRTEPGAGDRALRDSTIQVVTSRRPAPIPVPDVVGKSRDDAVGALQKVGLRVQETRAFNPDVPAGSVVAQNPRGRAVPRGSTVTLTISRGPDLVTVPGVTRQSLARATRTLEERGFTVRKQEFFGGLLGVVFRQSPGGGRQAPRGSTVTIDVF